MSETKLTILCDNTVFDARCEAEHGFSALIEKNGEAVIFDCGESGLFARNAAALGLSLDGVKTAVLSHNHYDHADGIFALSDRRGLKLYASENFEKRRFWIDALTDEKNETESHVDLAALERCGLAVVRVGDVKTEIADGVFILANVPRVCGFEAIDQSNFAEIDGETSVDEYDDELSLAIELENSLCVVSGCAHIGPANICERAKELFSKPVSHYFGGTHLISFDETRAQLTARYFDENGISVLGACHCSGEAGLEILSKLPCYTRVGAGFSVDL